jgi:hypothetical protein
MIISAAFTMSSFVLKRLSTDLFSALVDCIDQILAAITIGTSLPRALASTAGCSTN